MNIQQLIDQRKSLSYAQEVSLLDILGFKCKKDTKEKLKAVIKNKFYSKFDGQKFAKQFTVNPVTVDFTPDRFSKLSVMEEIKIIRETLLKGE